MRTRIGGLVACLIAASLAQPARAEQPSAAADRKINTSLRDVINRGKDFYNAGDPAACSYLFEGALRTVRPLLDHRPDVQKAIDRGLADAARHADLRRRAWALRYVLDQVRAKVKGGGWTAPPPGQAPPMPAVTLWSRLGGEETVKAVVDDFVAIAAPDPAVNFDRDGKFKFTEEQIAGLKKSLIAFISQAIGGPIKYTGKSMKEVHKGMGITNAEFDAAGADLVKALEKNGVAPADIKALMAIVGTTRADIVEAKKPEDEKPKEKAKPKDDEDKPKEKAKPKDDEDKPKEKAKDKDDEDKPKEKAKDKGDDDKPKEKEKIKKPKEDDEKPKEKDKDKDKDDEK